MIRVIDASVASKWFIAEPQTDIAEALLLRGDVLVAPDLIVAEICNVAWLKCRRGDISDQQAVAMIEGLPAMFDELVPVTELASRALVIASETDHPAYGCFYIALAERHGTQVVTADRRLLARLATTRWAAFLVGLGDAG